MFVIVGKDIALRIDSRPMSMCVERRGNKKEQGRKKRRNRQYGSESDIVNRLSSGQISTEIIGDTIRWPDVEARPPGAVGLGRVSRR